MVHLNYKNVEKHRPHCNTTKTKSCSSNREIKEKQNNYRMQIQIIQEQIDTEVDKWDIKERHNSSQRKYKITSRKSSGSSKKGYSAIKKTEKN